MEKLNKKMVEIDAHAYKCIHNWGRSIPIPKKIWRWQRKMVPFSWFKQNQSPPPLLSRPFFLFAKWVKKLKKDHLKQPCPCHGNLLGCVIISMIILQFLWQAKNHGFLPTVKSVNGKLQLCDFITMLITLVLSRDLPISYFRQAE